MSLNKYMHPRNKYRKPPNFKDLALKYPEFRKYAKQDISGKVSLDFKNPEAIRALTCTLLKEDFELDVEIPIGRLIPTLPLRLNYLLWIEDLLNSNNRTSEVKGIDIGCGASCIYPLLAAKAFGWQMLATEVDTESAYTASRNVRKNKLQDMIKVRTVEENKVLQDVLDVDTVYDFCMCNVPFFGSEEELDPQNVARTPTRPPPRNAHSGTQGELVVPGGELAFVSGIIRDSTKLRGSVRIYSAMVGHKSSVPKVKKELAEVGVSAVTTTEFCQGRTMRWGVAWTLDSTVTLPQTSTMPHSPNKKAPFSHPVAHELSVVVDKLKQLLQQLKITYSILKNNKELCAMEITAMEKTWAGARANRRKEKSKQNTSTDVINSDKQLQEKSLPKVNGESSETKGHSRQIEVIPEQNEDLDSCSGVSEHSENILSEVGSGKSSIDTDEKSKEDTQETHFENKEPKRRLSDNEECPPPKKPKTENNLVNASNSKQNPLLHSTLVVKGSPEGSVVEVGWLAGTGGREMAYQVFQYFKNNLK